MDYNLSERGRCETCGYFSKHGRGSDAPTPRFYEVERSERTDTNHIFDYYTESGRRVSTEIACFRHMVNFTQEINRLNDQGERNQKIVEMVRLDRRCDAWCGYIPGFNPMEHYEDMRMRQFESSLEADREARERSYQRQNVFLLITGCVIGFSQVLAAIVFGLITTFHESFTDRVLHRLLGY